MCWAGYQELFWLHSYLLAVHWQPMRHDSDVVPDMEVAAKVEALRQHLGSTHDYALHCPRAAPTTGVVDAQIIFGLGLLASIGGTVSYLFLVGACNAFCNSDLVLIDC